MKNEYSTSDFQLAVVLCALGAKLIFIDKTNPQRAVFQFEDDGQINAAVESYFRGELRLDPRIVLMQSKLVKDRLYQTN